MKVVLIFFIYFLFVYRFYFNTGNAPLFKRRRTAAAKSSSEPTNSNDVLDKELKKEVESYLDILKEEEFLTTIPAISFWQQKLGRYPNLAPIALQLQSMPATSASSERLFSCAGLANKGNATNVSSVLLEAKTLSRFNRHCFDY